MTIKILEIQVFHLSLFLDVYHLTTVLSVKT